MSKVPVSPSFGGRGWTEDLNILNNVLVGLSDFAAVTAWALGMNGRVAAALWGSIRLLLSVCSFPIAPSQT